MPIAIGMLIPESFIKANNKLWIPISNDNLENSYGQAMVIVDCDDGGYGVSVEMMNSLGVNWEIRVLLELDILTS